MLTIIHEATDELPFSSLVQQQRLSLLTLQSKQPTMLYHQTNTALIKVLLTFEPSIGAVSEDWHTLHASRLHISVINAAH